MSWYAWFIITENDTVEASTSSTEGRAMHQYHAIKKIRTCFPIGMIVSHSIDACFDDLSDLFIVTLIGR